MRRMYPTVLKMAGGNPQSVDGGDYDTTRSWENDPNVGNVVTADEYAAGETGTPAPTLSMGPTLGSAGATSYGTGGAMTEVQTQVTPTVEQLLGAWGMSNPTVIQPEATPMPAFGGMDPFVQSAMPVVSPATNASLITPMQEESGDYAKGVDGWRAAVISAAKTALGTPYTWGGNSLQGGVDCSGLVQQAFAKAGMTMPRVSYMQANRGSRVGLDALRPGDLVAWDNSSRNNGADHIAIYIGGGQIIEAARPGTAVRIRSVSSDEGAWGVHLNF
jgi:cell wall-associated NlpC family hydrolase